MTLDRAELELSGCPEYRGLLTARGGLSNRPDLKLKNTHEGVLLQTFICKRRGKGRLCLGSVSASEGLGSGNTLGQRRSVSSGRDGEGWGRGTVVSHRGGGGFRPGKQERTWYERPLVVAWSTPQKGDGGEFG